MSDALERVSDILDNYRRMDAMKELRDNLDELGIEWRDDSDSLFVRTKINLGERYKHEFSVIPSECCLLEAWHPEDDEPQGGLTVSEVMDMIVRSR